MRIALYLVLGLSSLTLTACSQQGATGVAPAPSASAPVAVADPINGVLPRMIVHKTPWCGCCTAWAEQAEAAGFAVELRDIEDMSPIKRALGVPAAQASCHTAEVEGYFVEGHVPFDDIKRLLAERPAARGIAVPGMPLGSPGMEAGVRHSYSVNLVAEDGTVSEYAKYPGDME